VLLVWIAAGHQMLGVTWLRRPGRPLPEPWWAATRRSTLRPSTRAGSAHVMRPPAWG